MTALSIMTRMAPSPAVRPQSPTSQAHEVVVLCDCGDIEDCRMERYVSDIRLLLAELNDPARVNGV